MLPIKVGFLAPDKSSHKGVFSLISAVVVKDKEVGAMLQAKDKLVVHTAGGYELAMWL